jgi:integrase
MSNVFNLQPIAVALETQIPTLSEAVESYFSVKRTADPSREQRLREWCPMLGHIPLDKITSQHILIGLRQIEKSPSRYFAGRDAFGNPIWKKRGSGVRGPSTVNKFLVSLQALFRFAKEEGMVPEGFISPARGIQKRPEPAGRVRYLSDIERTNLLEACRKSEWPRLWALVAMAISTGARKGELFALRWKDVNLERGEAILHTSKNGDRRVLILIEEVVQELKKFSPKDHLTSGDLLFQSKAFPTKPMAFRKYWEKAVHEAAIPDFRFHDCRHTCASILAQSGICTLIDISEQLGHRSLNMVKRYAHLSIESRRRNVVSVMSGKL